MKSRSSGRLGPCLLLLIPWSTAVGQAPESETADVRSQAGPTALPQGDVFRPLLADPKQPRFLASLLWSSSDLRDTQVAAVAFGEDFGLLRWGDDNAGLQLGLSGGVFAQFDVKAPSFDLMNADYVIGIPVTVRRENFSLRFRLYHQSSHLGDEFVIREQPDRINLSFESLEVLISGEAGPVRLYAGSEWIVHREPDDYGRGLLHTGAEFRPAEPLFRVGRLGSARFVAAVDGKAFEHHSWSWGWSGRSGLEFGPQWDSLATTDGAWADGPENSGGRANGRTWSVLLEFYNGPSPYGQFYSQMIRYVGIGIHLGL